MFSTAKNPAQTGYLPQLDGLRALAVLAVVAHHTLPKFVTVLDGGPAGVRLFFVLSGFLITGILLRARQQAETAKMGMGGVLGAFYGRRFLRIFPIYYLMLLVCWLLAVPVVRESLVWHLAYLTNIYGAYLGDWVPGPISHLWSLGVEEQFYLVWPFLVLFLPRRFFLPTMVSMILLAPVSRLVFTYIPGGSRPGGSMLPTSCLDSLAMGALLALLHEGGPALARTRERLTRVALVLGLILTGTVAAASFLKVAAPFRVAGKDLGYALLAVWLVHGAAQGFGGLGKGVLELRPLVYLGSISYGVYLYHGFVELFVHTLEHALGISLGWPTDVGVTRFLYVLGVTLAIAALSWHCFEKPLNRLKKYFPYVRTPARSLQQIRQEQTQAREATGEVPSAPLPQLVSSGSETA